jgi:hypothetical protein
VVSFIIAQNIAKANHNTNIEAIDTAIGSINLVKFSKEYSTSLLY